MHQCPRGQHVATVSLAVLSAKKDRWVVAVLPSPLTHLPLASGVFYRRQQVLLYLQAAVVDNRALGSKATPLLQVGDATLRRISADPPVQLRWGKLPHLRSERGALGPPPGGTPRIPRCAARRGTAARGGGIAQASELVPRPGPLAYPRRQDFRQLLTTRPACGVGGPGSKSARSRRGRARPSPGLL